MATFDGSNRLILLDGSPSESLRDIYSRYVDWLAEGDNLKYLLAFTVIADPPKVPLYATLMNGWRIRPLGAISPYILTFTDGFLYTAENDDPFVTVASGVEPRIRWENPVVAIGYDMGGSGGGGGATADDVWNHAKAKRVINNTSIIPAILGA